MTEGIRERDQLACRVEAGRGFGGLRRVMRFAPSFQVHIPEVQSLSVITILRVARNDTLRGSVAPRSTR